MIEISNSDTDRILTCLDIAASHYNSHKGLRNKNQARLISLLKDKIKRKLLKQKQNDKTRPH